MGEQYDKGYERARDGKDSPVGIPFMPSAPSSPKEREERERGFRDGQRDRAREEHEKKNEK